MIKTIVAAFLVLAFVAPAQAIQTDASVVAHSGGTDRNGCHIEHKTGIRHCH